ncbi:hypothetical protein [Inoviridae sp.]|nr:hypothetical protein [Inoviridae sp.]
MGRVGRGNLPPFLMMTFISYDAVALIVSIIALWIALK